MISQDPPTMSLPTDILNLMYRTIELVDLLYWVPVLRKGSRGEAEHAELMNYCLVNPPRAARPDTSKLVERGSSEERVMELEARVTDKMMTRARRTRTRIVNKIRRGILCSSLSITTLGFNNQFVI